MRKVCAKMVPKLLSPEQKESRMNICAYILNNIDTDPGLLDTSAELHFWEHPVGRAGNSTLPFVRRASRNKLIDDDPGWRGCALSGSCSWSVIVRNAYDYRTNDMYEPEPPEKNQTEIAGRSDDCAMASVHDPCIFKPR
ncbi:hypothetical protein NQ318_022403 [Aromia moschata]|uniref:Uncharacterized protein n=1 Tax=Aromia moschata TaxID=1265417 RepID=A0AAV8Z6H6_9CUCU|nr:hypothetical protein NQ318_022403 [Aromia moschata]